MFADDTHPRWLTAVAQLDYDTMAGTDKFGNMFVARLPADASASIENDPSGAKSFWDEKKFNGASKKLEEVSQYHVGDTCHSLSRVSLQPGGTECLVYTTMLGAIGAFVPFTSREDGASRCLCPSVHAFQKKAG